MPYPLEQATNKHDLLCPPLPPDGDDQPDRLDQEIGFGSTAALFQALTEQQQQPSRVQYQALASVYSYPDAPAQPLSRQLIMIGVADRSLSMIRNLGMDVADDQNYPRNDLWHRCTVAVKRADGKYRHQLKDADVQNSDRFAKLMRRLTRESVVGVIGLDKLNRFGILVPTHDRTHQGQFEGPDFAAVCFVGEMVSIRNSLTTPVTTSVDGNYVEDSSRNSTNLWRPPSSSTSFGVDGGTSNKNNSFDAGFSWKPPSSSQDFEFSGSWMPDGGDGTHRKRRRPDEDSNPTDTYHNSSSSSNNNKYAVKEFHSDSGAAQADAFYSSLKRELDTRADSRIYHMRAFNGWVKAIQIQELNPKTSTSSKGSRGTGGTTAPLRVLDLACGKGGDLGKWTLHPRGMANYVGIDVARGSLRDAAIRARKMRSKLMHCTFTCADLGADVPGRYKSPRHKQLQKLLTWSLQSESHVNTPEEPEFRLMPGGGISLKDRFDVVSIQFAIHYMMSTKKRARRFFHTVSQLLDMGGNLIATTIDSRVVLYHLMNLGLDLHFDQGDSASISSNSQEQATIQVGGGVCRIRFEPDIVKRIFQVANKDRPMDDDDLFGLQYTFTLVEGSDHAGGFGDAVNLPEWLTPLPVLTSLAEEAGLVLEYAQNFHEFFALRKDPAVHGAAQSSLYNMKVLNQNGSISKDEWEISRLYIALKFQKIRESTVDLGDQDDDDENDDMNGEDVDAEEEEQIEIDPTTKAKLLPMAMMKAKRGVGEESWRSLSSDEKTRLIEIEVRRLASSS